MADFVPCQQSWVAEEECMWPTSLKYLTTWSFPDKVCNYLVSKWILLQSLAVTLI